MHKAVFLDRDGTINIDYGYVYKPEDLTLLPGVVEALRTLQKEGYLLIVITNQSGVGRGYFTLEEVNRFNNLLQRTLKEQGVTITDFFTCTHAPEERCNCRKPSPLMVNEAIRKYDINPSQSYMLGDKKSDVECGNNANMTSYLVTPKHSLLYWSNQITENQ